MLRLRLRGLGRHHVHVLILLVELLSFGREEQVRRIVCELEDVGLLCGGDDIGGCGSGLLFVVDVVVFEEFLMKIIYNSNFPKMFYTLSTYSSRHELQNGGAGTLAMSASYQTVVFLLAQVEAH